MTTPTGDITLGNVATELGVGLPLTLGDSRVRSLAGVSSGPITLGQCRGKSLYVAPTNPAAGTVLGQTCSGVNLYNMVADGSGAYSLVLAQANSPQCGYVAPPAAGTVLSQYCSGTTLVQVVANGSGGNYTNSIPNSTACGYVAPTAAGTYLYQWCYSGNLVNVYADGNGGTYSSLQESGSAYCQFGDGAPDYSATTNTGAGAVGGG